MLKLLFSLFFLVTVYAQDVHVSLQGYLGQEQVDRAEEQLEEEGRMVLRVNSSSGDMHAALSLAHTLDDLKEKGRQLLIYVQGRAVGPAAVLPFLADELIVTPLVAWGDIPYGAGEVMTPDQIASAVRPLLKGEALSETVMGAMVDPHNQLLYKQEGKKHFDPLILNVAAMQSLGIEHQVLPDEDFAREYPSPKEEREALLDEKLHEYLSYSATGENQIGYLSIGKDRAIDQSTYLYVKFALKDFIEKGVRFIVLNLDTPGGEVFSALRIADLLQKVDLDHKIPVIAFIDDWAISAGAMLAYSCRFIGTLKNSIMGAAEPVTVGQQGQMESASEKVNSALRAQMGTLASFYGRNPLIAEAMVDKEMILVMRGGKIVQLQEMSEVRREGGHPDRLITARGKLLTLKGEELIDLGVASFMVPTVPTAPLTEKEKAEGMWPAHKSPLFKERYLAQIPHAVMIEYRDWRVSFFSFLTHPAIASLLFMGLVIGLYIEINTPGFGIPGSVALMCLALILLSSFSAYTINWIEVILLAAGLLLLALELFVIPGFGVTGILGIILTIAALFALMLPGIGNLTLFDMETFSLASEIFLKRLAWLCGSLILSIILILLMVRFFSHRYFRFSKLVLKGEQEGYVSGIPREMMPEKGDVGESVSPLRPSGKVVIEGTLFDGVTEGDYLETHTAIEVIRVEGSKVVVKPTERKERS